MKNYRVKELDGKFYPQERIFFFFWDNIKLEDRASRDWFVTSAENNCYDGTVTYLIAKDAWGCDTLYRARVQYAGSSKALHRRVQEVPRKKVRESKSEVLLLKGQL